MKNGKNLFYTIINATVILFSLIILSTCKDVGLGSSVDTTPPSVKIEQPNPSEVKRGAIDIVVNATDDGVVDTVLVTLKELGKSESAEEYNYNATFDEASGKYSIKIDTVHGTKEKGKSDEDALRPIADGTYQLVVKVTDAARRETTQMTTFIVDNTPPVIIVTSPDEKSAKMNCDIQIEGKVYDATDIGQVTVSFYNEAGVSKLTKDAMLTGTGEWKVSFDGEEELFANTENAKLDDGTYYYVITASDEVGNVSTYFFHKDDIYSVYKEKKLDSPKKLDSTSWALFDKGDSTKFEGLSQESLPEIRIPVDNTVDSTIAGGTRPEIDYSQERFATIKWQNIKDETDADGNKSFSMLNEGDYILGSISPEIGVDAPFVNSSFKAYIYETALPVDEKNNPTRTPDSEDLLDSSMWEITNAGTNRNFKISTRGFEGSLNPYYVYIEIKNASSETPYTSQQGFMISLTNPILTIDTPTNVTTKEKSFLIEGIALISNRKERCDLTYTVKKDGGTESEKFNIYPEATGENKGHWTLALKNSDGTYYEDGTYEFTFTAESQGLTTTKQCTIVLDSTQPTISKPSLTQNKNGTVVTVSGSADGGLSGLDTANGAEFKYCFVEKGTEPRDDDWEKKTNISLYSWKFDIDSSNLPETEHTLFVRIKDTAGNMTEESANIVIDKTNPALTVNGAENGKWVSNQIQAITGTASDPHFDKLTVKVGDGDAVEIPVNATTHEWSWQPAADTADGTYSVEFTATDKYLDDGSDKSKSTLVTTSFTLDRVRPEIEVQNIENGGVYRKGKDVSSPLEVRSMTTDELSGVQSIEYKVNDQLTYTPLENISSNWTVNLKNLPESENTIYIRATDKAGNTKELAPIAFKTDYYAPTAIFGEISGGQNNQDDWTNENNDRIETKENIVLTGKLLDAANTDTVTYTFSYSRDDGGTDEISVDSATFNNAAFASKGFTWDNDPESDTYGKWTYNLPTSKGEGTYVFTLSASDIAGNTTKRTRTVLVDTKAPDLTVTSPLEDEQITAAYKIAGTIRDDGSKFGNDESGIFYSFDRGENKTWTRLAVGSSAKWETPEISLPSNEGNQYVYVKAVDNLGNTTEVQERPYYYDKAAPVLYETSINSVDTVAKQDTFTLGGVWTETNELKSITIAFTKNGGATQTWATIIPAGTETDPKKGTSVAWSREIIVDTTDSDTSGEKLTSGLYEFTITAKDDAGKTASLIRRIRIDLVPPEDPKDITINGTSSTNGGVTYYNGELTIGGTAHDGGEQIAQSGIAKVQYSLTGGTDDSEWTNCNGTTSWTATIDSSVFTEEREYTIYFRAIDGSGLVNTGSVTRTINIDKSNPRGTIGVNGDFSNGIYQTNGTGTDENGNKFVLFSGTADDAYYSSGREALSATLSVSKDNGDSETVTSGFVWDNDPESEHFGEWSYKMPVPTDPNASDYGSKDGNYQYTLTVTDRAGKTTTKTKNILLDTTGPVISTSLSDNMSFLSYTNNVTISCFDTHAGLDSSRRLYWKLNDEDEVHLVSGSTATIVFKVQGINQKITFIAYDKLNNKTEVAYTGIIVDTEPPSLNNNVFNSAPQYIKKNGTFSLLKAIGTGEGESQITSATVVAHDEIAIGRFEITASKDGVRQTGTNQPSGYWYKKNFTGTDVTVADFAAIPVFVGKTDGTNDGTWLINVAVYDTNSQKSEKNYTFTIDATPPAIDIDAPTKTIAENEDASNFNYYIYNGTKYLSGTTVTLSGECERSENSPGTGIKTVRLYFNGSTTSVDASVAEKPGSDGKTHRIWTSVLDLANYSEGALTLIAEAEDNAGNVSETKVQTSFVVDKNTPTSAITQYKKNDETAFKKTSSSFETNQEFSLKGKVYDSYDGIVDVEIWEKIGSGDAVKIDTISTASLTTLVASELEESDSTGTQSWTLTGLPRNADNETDLEDGEYTYYAVAIDKAGKRTTSKNIKVTVDTTAPTLEIQAPPDGRTGENSLSGSSYIFRGNANDDEGGVGVTTLKYAFVKANDDIFGATNANPRPNSASWNNADWQSADIGQGSWSVTQSLSSETGTTDFGAVCDSGTLNEGHWYLFAKAIDSAGNESDVDFVHFHIDMASPVLSVTTNGIKDKENNTFYYKTQEGNSDASKFVLAGTATDSYGIAKVELTTKAGDAAAVTANATPTGNDATSYGWSYNVPVTDDTNIAITVKVTDKSGKTAEKKYTLYRDTAAPVITMTSPAAGESLTANTKTLIGTVVDAGIGINSTNKATITYEVYKGETKVAEGTIEEVASENWRKENVPLGDDEGTLTLKVKATDALGNESASAFETEFYKDIANPTLTENSVGTSELTTNGGNGKQVTLSGLVYDSNALSSDDAITITSDNGNLNIQLAMGNMTSVTETNYANLGATAEQIGYYNWTKTFTVGGTNAGTSSATNASYLADGKYTFTIKAKDVAGKETLQTRTVFVDTTAPAFTPTTEGGDECINYNGTESITGTDGNTWFKAAVVNVAVTVTDTAGSGISSVEYETVTSDGSSGNTVSNGVLRKGNNNVYTASVPLNDGANNGIRIIVTDAAGNKSDYPEQPSSDETHNYETIRIDTSIPSVNITGMEDSSGATISDDITNSDSFTINGTATDNGSGVDTVAVTVKKSDGTTVESPFTMASGATGGNWSITFNTAKSSIETNKLVDGTYIITITATDKATRTSSVMKTVQVDTTAPDTLSISAPANGTTGNVSLSGESYDFRGTVKDNANGSGMDKIYYAFVKAGDAISATVAAPTETSAWTDVSTADGAWSISKGLVAATATNEAKEGKLEEGHWYFFIKAADKAGNESSAQSVHFHVDMANPTLAVTTDGIKDKENSTYYYRNTSGSTTFALAGTVTESYGIASVNVTTKAGDADAATADAELTGNNETGYNWSYDVPVTANTNIAITVKVTDKSGKTAEKKYTLYRDTAAPVITITSPVADESLMSNSKTLSGTVVDAGVGINSANPVEISYTITRQDQTVASGTATTSSGNWSFSNVDLGSGEGALDLSVTAKDNLENESSAQNVLFYVDTANPTLTETSVGTGGLTTKAAVTLSGLVSDLNALDETAAVTISGKNTETSEYIETVTFALSDLGTSGSQRTWSKNYVVGLANGNEDGYLADGIYEFTITAKDVVGKTTTLQRTVTVDTTAPEFFPNTENGTDYIEYTGTNKTTVGDKTWWLTSAVPIAVKVKDARLSTVTYETLGGKTGALSKTDDDKWTATATLDEGENKLFLTANDTLGNSSIHPAGSAEIIYVDTTPPSIAVNANESSLTKNAFTLSGFVYDSNELSPSATVTIETNNGQIGGNDNVELSLDNLTQITAENRAEQGATEDQIGWYKWTQTFSVGSTNSSAGNYVLDGIHNFTITVKDVANRTTVANTTIQVDTKAPTIGEPYINTTTTTYISGTAVNVSVETADDNGSGIDNVKFTISGKKNGVAVTPEVVSATNATGNIWNYTLPLGDWDEGELSIKATSTDKIGNVGEIIEADHLAEKTFIIDQNKPVVSNISVKVNGNEISSEWINGKFTVSGTVTDSLGLSEDDLTLSINGSPIDSGITFTDETSTSYSWSYNVTGVESGSYEITVNAKDSSGKDADSVSRTVSVDTENPELTINLTAGAKLSGDSYTFRGTAVDMPAGTNAGVSKLQYIIDKTVSSTDSDWTNITVADNWTLPISFGNETGKLAEGSHTLEIRAEDSAGNKAVNKSVSFMVDLADPVLEMTNPASIQEYINEDCTFSGTIHDTNPLSVGESGSMTLEVTVNGSSVTPTFTRGTTTEAGTWSFTLQAPADHSGDGLKTIKIVATDAAGKTKEITKTLTIDTTPPTINAVNPGSVLGEFSLSANVYDTGKGVANVKYSFNENATEDAGESEDNKDKWNQMTLESGMYSATVPVTYLVDNEGVDNEGVINIYIRATDGLNPVVQEMSFFYDKANPSVTEDVITINGKTTNGGTGTEKKITLSGFVYDSYELSAKEAIIITAENVGTNRLGLSSEKLTAATVADTEALKKALGADSVEIAGWKKWNYEFTVGTGKNIGNDGTYVFTITAKDKAGKTTSIQRTVTIDTTAPTVDDSFSTPSKTETENASFRFNGNASDGTNGSGVAKVEIAFTNKDGTIADESIAEASGQADWNYTLVFSNNAVFNTEGEKDIHVRATDSAGNVGSWTKKTFLYDKSIPTSSIISYMNDGDGSYTSLLSSFFTGKSFSLKGKVYDSYGISSVEIYQKKGNDNPVQIATISSSALQTLPENERTASDPADTQYWTLGNLPRKIDNGVATENASVVDGEYKYYVKVTDSAAKTNRASEIAQWDTDLTVTVDTTAPTVTINSSDKFGTGSKSLSGSSYIFSVNAADNENGVGVDEIKYAFVKANNDNFEDSTAKPDMPSSWQTTTGTISQSLESGTGTTAAGAVYNSGTLSEGHWYLFVKAIDKAGNETIQDNIQSVHFHVDKAAPEIKEAKIDGNTAKENATTYTNGTVFTFSGKVEETYGIKSLEVSTAYTYKDAQDNSQNESATVDIKSLANDDDNWIHDDGTWHYKYTVPENAKDTPISVTITATDLSGKTDEKKYTLYKDTTAPDVTIISPAAGESFFNNSLNLKGTASDAGSGVANITYSITQGDGTAVNTNPVSVTRTGESWSANGVDFSQTDGNGQSVTQEGTFTLTITATDNFANNPNTTTKTATFYVDKANPTLNETEVGTGGKTTNNTFALSGWVYDSNALDAEAAVTITADKTITTSEGNSIELAVDNGLTLATEENYAELGATEEQIGYYKWTKTFTVGGTNADLSDGTYVFTITAKDVAGKTAQIQRTVTVDTTAPTFTPKTEGSTDYIEYSGDSVTSGGNTWRKSTSVMLSVNAADTAGGSGITSVEYEVFDAEGNPINQKSGSFTQKSGKWTATIPLDEGTNRIQIKATDVAGNVTVYPKDVLTVQSGEVPQYELIYIDTTPPSVTVDNITSPTNGGNAKEITLSGFVSDTNGLSSAEAVTITADKTITSNEGNSIKLVIDNGLTAATAQEISANNLTANQTWYKWSQTFTVGTYNTEGPHLADEAYTFTITAKDIAEITSNSPATKQVTIDTQAPEFSFKTGNNSFITSDSYEKNITTGTETWYGSVNLDIEGVVTDANEIKTVEWSWNQNSGYKSFSLIETEETGTYNFEGLVTLANPNASLKNGTLYIKATDKANNVKIYTADGENLGIRGINVDLGYPSISSYSTNPQAKDDGTLLLNDKQDLVVYVEAVDTADDASGSGIKNVKYKIGAGSSYSSSDEATVDGTVVTEPETDGTNSGKYKLTIPAATIKNGGATVYIQTKDYVGKTASASFSYQVDTKDPEVTIKTPILDLETDKPLNKTIQFSGTASDDNLLEVNLYYSTRYENPPAMPQRDGEGNVQNVWNGTHTNDGANANEQSAAKEKWVLLNTLTDATRYNWAEEINTALNCFNNLDNDIRYIHFLVEAYDAAGNCDSHLTVGSDTISRKVSTCIIDQNADRPVVSLREISTSDGSGVLMGKRTVEFIIEDDDGTVRNFYVSSSGADGSWHECTPSNGIYSYKYPDENFEDGEKTLYLKIIDGAEYPAGTSGTTFVSNTNDVSEAILIKGKDEVEATHKKILRFTIDTVVPTVNSSSVKIYARKDGDTLKDYTDSGVEKFSSTKIVGGTKNQYVDLYATAFDTSGIKTMSAKIGSASNKGEQTRLDLLSTDSDGNVTFRMSGIDVSEFDSGTYTLTITATDKTGSTGSYISSIRIDNDPPSTDEFSILTANTKDKIAGDLTLRVDAKDEMSGVKLVEYKIPKLVGDSDDINWVEMTPSGTFWNVEFIKNEEENIDSQLTKWCKADYTDMENPITDTDSGRKYYVIPIYFRMTDNMGNISYITKTNSNENVFELWVDPDGDKPVAKISYPAPDQSKITSLGGTIRIFGSAEDNEAIDSVYMQIDVNGDSKFDAYDKQVLSEMKDDNNVNIFTISTIGAAGESDDDNWGIKVNGKESWSMSINEKNEFGKIKVMQNDDGKLEVVYPVNNAYPEGAEVKPIGIRVRARDNKLRFGDWSVVPGENNVWPVTPVRIQIDGTSPTIGSTTPLQLVQYANGSVVASQDYQTDISIKGTWYLTGSADDDNKIDSITLKDGISGILGNLEVKNNGEWKTLAETDNTAFGKSVDFRLKIETPNNESGSLNFTISVTDDSTKATDQPIFIKYDNKKPEIGKLYLDEARSSFEIDDTTNIIEQSNDTFSIYGTVKDEDNGSKFSRLAVYFMREGKNSDSDRIYNPALPKVNGQDTSYNRTDIVTSGTGLTLNADNLPVLALTDASGNGVRSASNKFTLDSANPNIRVGGLIKIGGVYRLITEVSGTEVTFTPSVDTSYTTAEFVYALIIDHVIVETSNKDDPQNPIRNDDGDGIIESVEGNGNEKKWSVSINSKNIPDGPIYICCVAFDNAENVSDLTKVKTSVQNNRPLIANLWLGTDYDRSGSVNDNEFVNIRQILLEESDRDYTSTWKNGAASVKLDRTDSFKAVGTTVIKPEIVGGNVSEDGSLNFYYQKDPEPNSTDYSKLATKSNMVTLNHKKTASDAVTFTAAGKAANTSYSWSVNNSPITPGDENNTFLFKAGNDVQAGEFGVGSYTITVTDGTDGGSAAATVSVTKDGEDYTISGVSYSSSAYVSKKTGSTYNENTANAYTSTEYPITLNLQCDNDVANLDGLGNGAHTFSFMIFDNTENCTGNADPLYEGDILQNDSQSASFSVKFTVDVVDTVPPEASIDDFYWDDTTHNSVYYKDGKAKGHIELPSDLPNEFTTTNTGVNDRDPKVSGIIKIQGTAYDETCLQSISIKVDDFPGLSDYKVLSNFQGIMHWSESGSVDKSEYTGDNANNYPGYHFFVTDKDDDLSNGHSVKWELDLDTSLISNKTCADVDKKVYVKVNDTGNNDSTKKKTASGEIVDAPIPYKQMDIVPYITNVETEFSKGLKSSIKSAYSRTALGHYITRSDDTITIEGFNLTGGTVYFTKESDSTATADYTKVYSADGIEIPSGAKSGKISVVVNGIESLNNKNNNNACGSYQAKITESSLYSEKNTYAYNRMPNGTSNNLLTDDVVIDIWLFDIDAAKPMSGELREPSMQINPVTGQVGVAFVSGPMDFAMADSNNSKSYTQWQRNYATYNNISFVYDALGYAHATATGTDTHPGSTAHAGRFTYFYNKWGNSGLKETGNYEGSKAIRLESLAVPYIPSEVLESNPVDYETFLTMVNNGEVFTGNKTYYKILANEKPIITGEGVLTETRFYSPSLATTVHGTGNSASTSVYLAYYDSVQKQIRFRYNSVIPVKWTNNGFNANDDFVDNKGYYYNNGNVVKNFPGTAGGYNLYMEASTDNFSLIAGIDTQQGTKKEASQLKPFSVYKKDAEGNKLYTMAYYRRAQASFDSDGSLQQDKNTNGYTETTLKIEQKVYDKIHPDLQERFTVNNTVSCIKNGTYYYIIQEDGLILYTTDTANQCNGYMVYVVSSQKAHEHSFKENEVSRKLDPDKDYKVYERVPEDSTGYKKYDSGGAPYFWPYAKEENAIKVDGLENEEYEYYAYDTGYTGYKYVAIDAKKGDSAAEDVVVAVWFDGTCLRYAYTDNPTNGKDNNIANNNLDENSKGWKGNKVIFSEGGEHCTVKFDPNGGVHIAAYVDGSLRYAYLPSYSAAYNEETASVLVDSYTITGERINLDVGLEQVGTTNEYVAVPYISYYNGTARVPTVAKLVIPENGVMNYKAQGTGTSDGADIFTGNWEISLVPTQSTLTSQYYDKMNIGLWKNAAGKIVESTNSCFTITGAGEGKTSADNSSSTTNGNIYGNGTANPILGYAVESISGTYLETAQMK